MFRLLPPVSTMSGSFVAFLTATVPLLLLLVSHDPVLYAASLSSASLKNDQTEGGHHASSLSPLTLPDSASCSSVFSASSHLFVFFTADWCIHCRQLAKLFSEAHRLSPRSVALGTVNCSRHSRFCQALSINALPEFRFVSPNSSGSSPAGNENCLALLSLNSTISTVTRYTGSRDSASEMAQWLRKRSEPISTSLTSLREIRGFVESHPLAVIGFLDSAKKLLEDTAVYLDEASFAHCLSESVLHEFIEYYKRSPSAMFMATRRTSSADRIFLLKPFDEGLVEYAGDLRSVGGLFSFVSRHSCPHVLTITDPASAHVALSRYPRVLLLLTTAAWLEDEGEMEVRVSAFAAFQRLGSMQASPPPATSSSRSATAQMEVIETVQDVQLATAAVDGGPVQQRLAWLLGVRQDEQLVYYDNEHVHSTTLPVIIALESPLDDDRKAFVMTLQKDRCASFKGELCSNSNSTGLIEMDSEEIARRLVDFLASVKEGTAKQVWKTDPIPLRQTGPLYKLVAATLSDVVTKSRKFVLVLFYAEGCGHSDAAREAFETFAQTDLYDEDRVLPCAMEGVSALPRSMGGNEKLTGRGNKSLGVVNEYPSIILYPPSARSAVQYEGNPIDLDNLKAFLNAYIA